MLDKIIKILREQSDLDIDTNLHFGNYEAYIEDALVTTDTEIYSGTSKVCIIPLNENRVLKIPFTHLFDEDAYDSAMEPYNNKEMECIPSKSDYTTIFCGAQDVNIESANCWDYCALECNIYEAAIEQGLAQYFAAEELYGDINGYPVYIQDRAVTFDMCHTNWRDPNVTMRSLKSRDFCQENKIECFNSIWIADFIDLYGKDEFIKLSNFIKKYGIDDLRDPNIGYIDNLPVLVDYSGFREW